MKKKTPAIITILILTLITVLFWVGFGVFRVFTTGPKIEVPPEVLNPLTPTLDNNALEAIEQSIYFGENELVENIIISNDNNEDIVEDIIVDEDVTLPEDIIIDDE